MQKAIVTCSLKGAVLKEYSHNIPEALDASRTVGPANQELRSSKITARNSRSSGTILSLLSVARRYDP